MTRTDVSVISDGTELGGSVWTPDAAAPTAVVLMYPGSGPSDRDNDVFFPPIREKLLSSGFAVGSFDKRGVGASGGSWLHAGIDVQAHDLIAFAEAAQQIHPDTPVGLFGHSQGGWVVIEAAAQFSVDFVITSSGPGVTPREQEEFSARTSVETLSLSDEETGAVLSSLSQLFERLSDGSTWAEVQAWMSEPVRAQHFAALSSAGAFVPDGPELWQFAGLIINFDPRTALSAIRVPLLAVFGSLDDVVPVELSVASFRRQVRSDLLTVCVVPGGDHRIQDSGTGAPMDAYLSTLSAFVATASKGVR